MTVRLLISEDLTQIKSEIEKTLGSHHPDLLYFAFDQKLGIEQARQIKNHFFLKPYSAKGKALVLEDAGNLTIEAQNALLKTLEEPPEKAMLLLGAKDEAVLLPTVVSRCQIIILDSPKKGADKYSKDIQLLLQSGIQARFEYIEKCKERKEFLHALVAYFRTELHAPRQRLARLEVTKFLKELLQAERWSSQNVNIRAILEYLMLVMPGQI